MAKVRRPQTEQQDKKPAKRPPWRSRLWARTGLSDKTLWDVLQLLIVPFVLAAIGFWFTAQQEARQHELEEQRARIEREIQDQRAQQATLQAYLDQMGVLLLDRELRAADENSDVSRVARARTVVVLDALDASRQERVLRFLNEAELIRAAPPEDQPVIPLKYVKLSNIELPYRILLRGANLQQADLSESNLANIDFRGTYLAGAHLEGANLQGANLEGADLSGAFLKGADLSGANLTDVDLSNAEELWEKGTDLWERGAGLGDVDLRGANLSGADLSNVNLSGANLEDAIVTDEQLAKCKSLEGATLPNGSKHRE